MKSIRLPFGIMLFVLAIALVICSVKARKSKKVLGRPVSHMISALVPPVVGNMIIILSSNQILSRIGCYIYFLGMDFVMLALIEFTNEYCRLSGKGRKLWRIGEALLAIDFIQLCLNPIFKHAFTTEAIIVEGRDYFRLIPLAGQTFHRVVDYGILAIAIIIFLVKLLDSPKIESERYSVILLTMVFTTIWESAYIFSRAPVDRAMVGFGVFGLLIYYLALHYRPLRLLDRILAQMASNLPEALFFFDSFGQCIWANNPGIKLAELDGYNFEPAYLKLREMFGSDFNISDSERHSVYSTETKKGYVLQRQLVNDDKGRLIGSFLSVRDNTEEQEALRKEIYKATHDSLTSLHNRAGYNFLLSTLDLSNTYLLVIDVDSFKSINDNYGHEVGDKVLQKVAKTIKGNFRSNDYVCRIGGDEFVVFIANTDDDQRQIIIDRVAQINAELADSSDSLPPVSVSVGAVMGSEDTDAKELFEKADRALYERKRNGKNGITFSEIA